MSKVFLEINLYSLFFFPRYILYFFFPLQWLFSFSYCKKILLFSGNVIFKMLWNDWKDDYSLVTIAPNYNKVTFHNFLTTWYCLIFHFGQIFIVAGLSFKNILHWLGFISNHGQIKRNFGRWSKKNCYLKECIGKLATFIINISGNMLVYHVIKG